MTDLDRPAVPASKLSPVTRGALVVGVAAVAGLLTWILLQDDDKGGPSDSGGAQPQMISPDEFADFRAQVGHQVYWAGEQDGAEIEATTTPEKNVFLRYLTGGADAGDTRDDFLTIGTYPFANAYRVAVAQAKAKGNVAVEAPGGGRGFYSEAQPTSIYLAYPRSDFQIEVYDPDPQRALDLVRSGDIVPLP